MTSPPTANNSSTSAGTRRSKSTGLVKEAIRGYLASVTFSDAQHGASSESALDEGSHRENTVVILISDHGFHLGEKQQLDERGRCGKKRLTA